MTTGEDTTYTRPVARVGDSELVTVRQEQIVRVAKKLFARQGFSKTTISEIAREAGFSTGLVYEYVRTKEDILFLMLERNFDKYRTGLTDALSEGENALENLMNGVHYYVREVDQDRDGVLVWYRETLHLSGDGKALMKAGERSIIGLLSDAIEVAQSQELIKPHVDPWNAATIIELTCHGRALKPYVLGGSSSDFAAAILSTILDGLATHGGRTAFGRYKSRAGRL